MLSCSITYFSLNFKGLPNMNGNQPSLEFTIKGNFYPPTTI
ncbi:hypothetical protein [Helicobacter pylori]|nr:hypothetical protein [Helicobacter pylori]